jgi:O-acetylhomoserine (thiol)-lyase
LPSPASQPFEAGGRGRDLGAAISPFNSFLILTGIETLPLRMEKHCANALEVAKFLQGHKGVEWVRYAGLKGDPSHELAKRYTPKGAGAVFTFGVKGGYEAGVKLVSTVKLLSHVANIGDTRSLIIHPASTTHRQLTDSQKTAAGAGPEVVRVSIGIEDAADIIADLAQALEMSQAPARTVTARTTMRTTRALTTTTRRARTHTPPIPAVA